MQLQYNYNMNKQKIQVRNSTLICIILSTLHKLIRHYVNESLLIHLAAQHHINLELLCPSQYRSTENRLILLQMKQRNARHSRAFVTIMILVIFRPAQMPHILGILRMIGYIYVSQFM